MLLFPAGLGFYLALHARAASDTLEPAAVDVGVHGDDRIRLPDALTSGTATTTTTIGSHPTPPLSTISIRENYYVPFPEYLRDHEHVIELAGGCYQVGWSWILITLSQ